MKKFLSFILGIAFLLGLSLTNASDVESLSITLNPGLNTFSTPAVLKSVSFSNGGSNISFAKMENGKWMPITVNNSNIKTTISPLNGYLIRNSNSSDVTMTLEYDKDNSDSLVISKNLDAGWNFLGVTTTNKPFDSIANATATMILDLTNGENTNLIQLGKTFINATRFMLGKAYAVFVTNANGVYGGINNYGDNNCVGMDMAGVKHTVKDGVITLEWDAVDGDVVEISIFNPVSEAYESLGTVSMSAKKFSYTARWEGEHQFKLSNGCGTLGYKADIYNDDELFKSCWLNPDVLCQFDDQGHLSTPETCPSYCLREELINNISEGVEYTKGEATEREVFNGYFKSRKGTIGIDKINIFCGNEEGFCFNNMIFYLNIGQSNYIVNNQGSLTLNNIYVEENKSIPISIYAYTNNSNFETVGKYVYYLSLNLSNGDESGIRLVPMYTKNPGGQTYENNLVYSYNRAYENGIIIDSNIDNAGLYDTLSNASMKTILLNFANHLGYDSDLMLESFGDLFADEETSANRANFATALSRIIWGDKYEGGTPYYKNHLEALKAAGIMNQIDNPEETVVIKGYVLTTLMGVAHDETIF